MSEETIKVLLVEDSPTDALIVKEELTQVPGVNFDVTQVERLGDALQTLQAERFGVVLLDLSLPDSEGFTTFTRLHDAAHDVPVVVLSGRADEVLAVKAVKAGAQDYLVKGRIEEDILARAIRYAIERKRSEGALAESERRLREMLENVHLIAVIFDDRGVVTFCNNHLLRVTGWQREEVIGANWFDKFIPGSVSPTQEFFFASLADGKISDHHANSIKTRAGELREIAWNNTMLRGATGQITGMASIGEDVTERNRSELTLRASEERFRQVVENIQEVFWMTDVEKQHILYISPGYEAVWGRTCDSLYTSPITWQESIHPDDRARVGIAAQKQIIGGYDETYRINRPDGTSRWIRDRAYPIRDSQGRVHRVVGTAEDITVRKKAELRLTLQHAVTAVLAEAASPRETNLKILETIGQALQWELGELWVVDRAAKVLRCAEIWHPETTEFKEFAAVTREMSFALSEGLPGCVWESGQSEWSDDVTVDERCRRRVLISHLGRHAWIGFPIRIRDEILGVMEFFSTTIQAPDVEILAVLSDLGAQVGIFMERRQLAERFRQAQKMEAIGTLAGGIAHDFNNVLACIQGYTELAQMQLDESDPAGEYLSAILKGSKRASDLVRQILAFSRQQELQRKPIQLRVVVGEALELLRATIPATIEFDTSLALQLPKVLADGTQVHQIVMNLCMNAAHAMKERPGKLTVVLEVLEVDATLALTLPGIQRGPHVHLSVSDTGRGMDRATLSRIFEPFFTTKAAGEGTGLGLAVVHGIMQSHEGAISAYSHLGEGSTFHLYFPPHAETKSEAPFKPVAAKRGNGERILYVDDEAMLATMGKKILERLGYVVDERTSSPDALAAVRAHPEAYDLVITDQMMPELMGTDFADLVHAIRPDLPIILTTGYTATLNAERVQAMGIRRLLLKPLSVDDLGQAVGEVLSEARTIVPLKRVLVVEDDEPFRAMLQVTLTGMKYEVVEARNGKDALQQFQKSPPDVVLIDIIMPEKEGLDTIIDLRRKDAAVIIIAMSGGGRVSGSEYLKLAKALGANGVLAKPFSNDELKLMLENLLAATDTDLD